MSTNKNLTIINAWICQISGQKIIPVFGDILISDGRISDITKKDFNKFLPQPLQSPDKTINAGGRVITVPMINFHDHFYSRLAKGLPIKNQWVILN